MKSVLFVFQRALSAVWQRFNAAQIFVVSLVMCSPMAAFAQTIPEVPLPAGQDQNNLPRLLLWGLGIIILLCGCFLAAWAILSVGASAIHKFGEMSKGKIEAGEVVTTAGIGVGILVFALLLIAGALRVMPAALA